VVVCWWLCVVVLFGCVLCVVDCVLVGCVLLFVCCWLVVCCWLCWLIVVVGGFVHWLLFIGYGSFVVMVGCVGGYVV
jgi:hypothetical protein